MNFLNRFRNPRPVWLATLLLGGCAATEYHSPAPGREQVSDVRARIEATVPHRRPLALAEAEGLVRPIFDALSEDAAMICRTVSEADSCNVPAFEVVDLDQANARTGYDLQNRPKISLTRGLVEYLADQPDELALVIGFEAFGVGVGTAAFVAYIARCTHPAYTATQFALFTSLAAVPRTFINAGTGWLVEHLGWMPFFLLCAALAVPGMMLLLRIAPWHGENRFAIRTQATPS